MFDFSVVIGIYFALIAASYLSNTIARLVNFGLLFGPLIISGAILAGKSLRLEVLSDFFSFIESPFNTEVGFTFDAHTLAFLILISYVAAISYKTTTAGYVWLLNSFLLSVLLSSSSTNVFSFLIFFEAASVFLFFMAFFSDQGKISSLRFLKYSVFSFASILCGLLLISKNQISFGFLLIWLGLILKSPLPPFNSWQLAAYGACSPIAVLGMSGILSKLPLLLLIKFIQAPNELALPLTTVTVLLSLVASLNLHLDQDRIRKLAYLSSLHIGVFLAAVISQPGLSTTIFSIFVLGHGLFVSFLLFTIKNNQAPSLAHIISALALISQPFSLLFWVDIVAVISIFNASTTLAITTGLALAIGSFGILHEVTHKPAQILRPSDIFVWIGFLLGFFPRLLQTPPAEPELTKSNKYEISKDFL